MITYRVVESSPERVVVAHPHRDRGALVVLGVLAVAAAAMLAWLGPMPGAFRSGPLTPFLAFFAFLGTLVFAIRAHWYAGHTLRFEAASGTMTLADAAGRDVVAVPLTAVASVEVRETRSTSGPNGGRSRRFHTDAVLADGAKIPVYQGGNARIRDTVADALRAVLASAASRPPAAVPTPVLAASFAVEQDRRETRVAWQSRVRAASFLSLTGALIFVWLLLGVFIRALLGISGAMRWLPIGFLFLWGTIPTLVLGLGLVHQLRMHRRRHLLRVTEDGVSYESRGTLLRWPVAWTLGRDAVASVRLRWGTSEIELPGPDVDGTPEAKPKVIELGTLPKEQIVAFEQWLERELTGRWGRRVG